MRCRSHAPSFAARVLLVLLYLEAHLRIAAARRFTWLLMIGFTLSAVAWGAQEWLATPWDRRLYVTAVGIELLAPLLAVTGLGQRPAHPTHLPERLGLFTIIVLGEAVLGVVVGGVRAEARLPFAVGFSLPVGMWWFYFHLLDRSELRRRVGGGQILTYLHLPMTLAVVVMAAAVEVSLAGLSGTDSEAEGGGEPGLLAAVGQMVDLVRTGGLSVADGTGLAGMARGAVRTGARLLFWGLSGVADLLPGNARLRGGPPPPRSGGVDHRGRGHRAGGGGGSDRTGAGAGAVHIRRGVAACAGRAGVAAAGAAPTPGTPPARAP